MSTPLLRLMLSFVSETLSPEKGVFAKIAPM